MQQTNSAEPLDAVAYFDRGDGTADVYLRRNIATSVVDTEDGSYTAYVADEVHGVTDKPKELVDLNFDATWAEFERASMSSDELVADLESQLEEQASAINELALIMAGGE